MSGNDLSAIHDMVIRHEHSLDTLSTNIGSLVKVSDSTNGKLDKLTDAISHQSVIMEKLHNMDTNVREGFKVRDAKIEELVDIQNNMGCHKAISAAEEVRSVGKSLDTVRGRVEAIETQVKETVSVTTMRWSFGLLFVLMVAVSGTVLDIRSSQLTQLTINKHQEHTNRITENKFNTSDTIHTTLLGKKWPSRAVKKGEEWK